MIDIPDDRGTAFELAVFKLTGADCTLTDPIQRRRVIEARETLMKMPQWDTEAKRARPAE